MARSGCMTLKILADSAGTSQFFESKEARTNVRFISEYEVVIKSRTYLREYNWSRTQIYAYPGMGYGEIRIGVSP